MSVMDGIKCPTQYRNPHVPGLILTQVKKFGECGLKSRDCIICKGTENLSSRGLDRVSGIRFPPLARAAPLCCAPGKPPLVLIARVRVVVVGYFPPAFDSPNRDNRH